MCSGVCSSEPHSQWAESARPSLCRCFLSPQWPVHRRKMVVWVLLSRVLNPGLVCAISWHSCPRLVYISNKNTPSMHHPGRWNVTTSMVGLKNGHIRKKSHPRDIAGNAEEEQMCVLFFKLTWSSFGLYLLLFHPSYARSSIQWVRWSSQSAAVSQPVPKASCGHPPDWVMSGVSKCRRWGRTAGCVGGLRTTWTFIWMFWSLWIEGNSSKNKQRVFLKVARSVWTFWFLTLYNIMCILRVLGVTEWS